MTPDAPRPPTPWSDARLAAGLFALDPRGTGGVVLRARPGPARDRWLEILGSALPASTPVRRVPLHVADGRLLGGLDLAATLRSGRPVAERGILAESDGGVVVLATAERLSGARAAQLVQALDAGEVALEREGVARRSPSRFGVVALDEGLEVDERPPAALCDRLAFRLDLSAVTPEQVEQPGFERDAVAAARTRQAAVAVDEETMRALCETAMALGIDSLRAPLLALRVARAAAAWDGRTRVTREDAGIAARLVLAPRARALPASEAPQEPGSDDGDGEERDRETRVDGEDAEASGEGSLSEWVLETATASMPEGLLEALRLAELGRTRAPAAGRSGVRRQALQRGRPCGVRRGAPRDGARLNLIETLRAAAPWQPIRRRESALRDRRCGAGSRAEVRVEVRSSDFRVTRYQQRSETTVIFAVDASGSAALHRLAEAKGAVERLLADCYVRRDSVALVAFRRREAEILLPPTRSLVRAKRCLAALPGGGGTPLAAGIEAAAGMARAVLHRGGTPLLVFLTDGRANVARDGRQGRAVAEEDALAAARNARAEASGALLLDTSPRPQAVAEKLARELGASYLPLPHADSAALSQTVRSAMSGPPSNRAPAW